MKLIKVKDFKVGDWILLVNKKNKRGIVENIGNFILIIKETLKEYDDIFKAKIFVRIDIDTFSKPKNNDITITNSILKQYKLFKLSERETQKYKAKFMLKELEKEK